MDKKAYEIARRRERSMIENYLLENADARKLLLKGMQTKQVTALFVCEQGSFAYAPGPRGGIITAGHEVDGMPIRTSARKILDVFYPPGFPPHPYDCQCEECDPTQPWPSL